MYDVAVDSNTQHSHVLAIIVCNESLTSASLECATFSSPPPASLSSPVLSEISWQLCLSVLLMMMMMIMMMTIMMCQFGTVVDRSLMANKKV